MKRILFLILVLGPSAAGADKSFNQGKGTTWDCKKDPVVSINHGGGTYKLKGACTTINVNGAGGTFTIDSVDTLSVTGAKAKVTVGTVGTISVTGTQNKVTWKAAKNGDAPAISDVGRENVIVQAGAPASKPAEPAKPAESPAAPATPSAGAIDCGKQATHMITDNDLTLSYVGKCELITVTGNDVSLRVESVKALSVSGNDNKALVEASDKIYVTGNDNIVTYRKGISAAKPKLSNTGNGNKISAAK